MTLHWRVPAPRTAEAQSRSGKISGELKISTRLLEAIEDEEFDKLPGGVFAKSFVRQYARLLGLDEDEMAAEVQHALAPAPEVPQFAERPKPACAPIQLPRIEEMGNRWATRGSAGGLVSPPRLLVAVMLVCSGVYAFWQQRPATRVVAPKQTARPHGVPERAGASTAAAADAAPSATQPPPAAQESQPPRPSEAPQAAGVTAAVLKPAAASAGAPDNSAASPNPNATVHVEITADEAAVGSRA